MKFKLLRPVAAGIAAVTMLTLAACSPNSNADDPNKLTVSGEWKGSTKIVTGTIGVINAIGASENQSHWESAARQGLEAVGWDATVIDGKGDAAVQGQAISSLVQQKVDAIIYIGAIAADTNASQLQQAKDAGIPVLLTGVKSPDPEGMIAGQFAPDDADFGPVMADYLAEKLPDGATFGSILLTAFAGGNAPNVSALPILETAGHKRAATVDLDLAGDLATQVSKGVVDMAASNPDLKAITSCCDFTAAMSAPALQQAGHDDIIQAVRYDNLSTLQLIRDGYPVAVVAVNEVYGVLSAVSAVVALKSSETPIKDSAAALASKFEFEMVDADNLPEEGKYYFDDQELFKRWISELQQTYSEAS